MRFEIYRVRISLLGGSCVCWRAGLLVVRNPQPAVGSPRPNALAQRGMVVVALQGCGRVEGLAVGRGKGLGQLVERAAHNLHVVRAQLLRTQGGLRRLVLHVYRLLALDLPPRHSQMSARTLFERMMCTGATVRLDENTCVVTLKKKRNLPALLETLHAQKPVRILWIGNRRIVYEGDTRS